MVGLKLTLDAVMKGNDEKPQPPLVPVVPVCAAVALAAAGYTYFAAGGQLGDHTPYLGGLGNLCALQPRTPATQTPSLHLPELYACSRAVRSRGAMCVQAGGRMDLWSTRA